MSEDTQPKAADSATLDRLSKMAQVLLHHQRRVEALTQELADAKTAMLQVEREDLPELMRELEFTLVRLDDGSTIELKDEVDCSITEARRATAHKWLIENGFGGLIRCEVSVKFDRDEREAAWRLAEQIGGSVEEKVHPSTLKSFVKEQMEAGRAVPSDLFGVFPYSKAVIKPPKAGGKKKGKGAQP